MTPDLEPAIAHLDFEFVICECESESCGGQCPNPAEYRCELHALDHCDSATHDDVNEDGNRTLRFCAPCYETIRIVVAQRVILLSRYGRPMCVGCGAPVRCVKDVIREVEKL